MFYTRKKKARSLVVWQGQPLNPPCCWLARHSWIRFPRNANFCSFSASALRTKTSISTKKGSSSGTLIMQRLGWCSLFRRLLGTQASPACARHMTKVRFRLWAPPLLALLIFPKTPSGTCELACLILPFCCPTTHARPSHILTRSTRSNPYDSDLHSYNLGTRQ